MEYNNSNANGIIKHICLNEKISLYFCLYSKDREKTTKNGFFFTQYFYKSSRLQTKNRCITFIVCIRNCFVFFSSICAFLSISLLIQANNFENCSFRLFIHIIFFPGYFHHSSNDERCLVKSSYCVELFELFFFLRFSSLFDQQSQSTIEKISNRNLINRIWFCFMH